MCETGCPPSIQACKTRTILTLPQVIQIFTIKKKHLDSNALESKCSTAAAVAKLFRVSEKAIRDIWSGRTWVRETMHLDPASAAAKAQRLRLPGRPKRHETEIVSDRNRNMANQPTSNILEYAPNLAAHDTRLTANMSEYVTSPPASVIPEKNQHMPRLLLSSEPLASLYADDPFHDDWPHWEAAREWEQHAIADGYCSSTGLS